MKHPVAKLGSNVKGGRFYTNVKALFVRKEQRVVRGFSEVLGLKACLSSSLPQPVESAAQDTSSNTCQQAILHHVTIHCQRHAGHDRSVGHACTLRVCACACSSMGGGGGGRGSYKTRAHARTTRDDDYATTSLLQKLGVLARFSCCEKQ